MANCAAMLYRIALDNIAGVRILQGFHFFSFWGKIKELQKMLSKAATEMVILDYRLWSANLTPKESNLRNHYCRRDTWETDKPDRDKIRRTKQRLHQLSSKYYPTTISQQFAECVATANHQFWLS